MATVSAPAKRAQRLRPAPLWLSLLLAFLAYFLLDFSLRLFYGSMSNVSLWAWQPLVFTLLWSGTMTAIAALLPRTGRRIFLLITFVPFALLAITNCVLYQLTGTCFPLPISLMRATARGLSARRIFTLRWGSG